MVLWMSRRRPTFMQASTTADLAGYGTATAELAEAEAAARAPAGRCGPSARPPSRSTAPKRPRR